MHLPASAVSVTMTPTPEVDPDLVTPGVWGFAIIVFIALAVILLIWDMLRRIRRGRVRAEIAEELDAEEAARAEETPRDGDAADGADPEGSQERG
ncbi:hypothetical protein P0L94_02540 [Microbacter sp. GSS18]|nr:hypothetical protein P0L94_02540 [Microbacter sp. GSS18]